MITYLLIGLCFSLVDSRGGRPSVSLALLWPMALVPVFCGVVLGGDEG